MEDFFNSELWITLKSVCNIIMAGGMVYLVYLLASNKNGPRNEFSLEIRKSMLDFRSAFKIFTLYSKKFEGNAEIPLANYNRARATQLILLSTDNDFIRHRVRAYAYLNEYYEDLLKSVDKYRCNFNKYNFLNAEMQKLSEFMRLVNTSLEQLINDKEVKEVLADQKLLEDLEEKILKPIFEKC